MDGEMTDQRLHELLSIWADVQRNDHAEIAKLGYPSRSAVFLNGGSVQSDAFAEMCDAEDRKSARAMEGIIDSLPTVLRIAVEISHDLCAAVFTFKRIGYEEALSMAHAEIKRIAHKRGVV